MSSSSPLPGRVVVTGMVPPGASGVRDYGRLLAAELSRQGFDAKDIWVVAEGRRWREALVASVRFLRLAVSLPRDTNVVWNYSSFAYGYRGLPLAGVFFGALRRIQGTGVVTVLHELSYPWGRRGWRGNVQSATQWLALHPVVAGSTAVVVTTDQRAEGLRRRRWPGPGRVHSVPVFCTIGVPEAPRPPVAVGPRPVVGVLNYTGDGARPDVVIGALARLDPAARPSVVLLGAPGPDHPMAQEWTLLAKTRGVSGCLEFSGVVPHPELRTMIERCDVIVLPNDHGPSGRRTTLGAALAHGIPTLALDGPERWEELATAEAIELVRADEEAVASALQRLLRTPERRRQLSVNGRGFYDRHMAVEHLGRLVADFLRRPPSAARPRLTKPE